MDCDFIHLKAKHESSQKDGKFTALYFGGSVLEEPKNRNSLNGLVELLRRWLDRRIDGCPWRRLWGRRRGDEDRVRAHFGDHRRGCRSSIERHCGEDEKQSGSEKVVGKKKMRTLVTASLQCRTHCLGMKHTRNIG
ncbi:hypothetical protein SAY87_006301 [Trapa incisa]|uniref:Uncharacterized protein n=1 Tax=Trapa incisa TaxID=236973 RepID=A0AAN7JZ85_9MYRT|nr:hypothetical protein SAY87_006301 [Trapa incisa]